MPGVATQAVKGYGTVVKIGDGATPEVFSSIRELQSVGALERNLNTTDATHMESPDEYEEFIATFHSQSEITLGLRLVPADPGWVVCEAASASGRLCNFKIIPPSGMDRSWEFKAIVTKISTGDFSKDSPINASITLKPSGNYTVKKRDGTALP